MNAKLFFLIHNERGYKRYYYQPLAKDDFFHRFCHETAVYVKLLISALRFPFDKRFNHPQYGHGGVNLSCKSYGRTSVGPYNTKRSVVIIIYGGSTLKVEVLKIT